MKVIAINGSPRKDGNTHQALTMVGDELQSNGILQALQIIKDGIVFHFS